MRLAHLLPSVLIAGTGTASLEPHRILIVEDNSTLAILLAEMMAAFGYAVVGPARDLPAALTLAGTELFDCAILDVDLGGGQTSIPVARLLLKRRIPFLFATAYDVEDVDAEFRSARILRKPVPAILLRETLRGLML